jgi:hypothetical protein
MTGSRPGYRTAFGVLISLCVIAAAATGTASTAKAANSKPTTGSKVSLFAPPSRLAANTPFYIEQGFICPSLGDGACMEREISAKSSFTLYVDGVVQPSTVDVDVVNGGIEKRYLTNFPAGLPAGAHTFVGVFDLDGSPIVLPAVTITFS